MARSKTIALSRDGRLAGSPERAWPFVAEPELLVRWFVFAKRFEVLEGGAGAAAEGSTGAAPPPCER